ncbi:M1 family aminopeptidase [Aeromicrobium endophyticum]|uniref:Aminopeptidase N n=1 Tax=Aeromicrobium endophyticum TaxID=2292704 RepID=A0A371P3V2_9ACTN|nr:M1 family aminopeptidase [Aeromicrobium endophyticum]REK70602.1 M1 family peptidase [Aeromicrobium endophyticum]
MALAARHHLARLASLALVSGMLVVTTGTGPAQAAEPVAGGLSAGDSLFPNQGNSGYDALHYDIDLTVDVAVSSTNNAVANTTFSAARTAVTAKTTGAPLSSFAFDFQGTTSTLEATSLVVDAVTVDGAPAAFERIETTTVSDATTDVHKIVVTPATPVDGEFTTVVTYHGKPVRHTDTDTSWEGWNNTRDGATFLNQPVGSMTVFPNNNTPRDKATYSISVDAPSKLTTSSTSLSANPGLREAAVVSNGELMSKTPSEDGTRTTWVWNQKKQMASELTLISIGRYDMYESDITLASGRTLHEWSFIDPSIPTDAQATTQASRGQLKSIVDFLEKRYGPYPGNSIGLVTDVVPGKISYALETQDRSFFPGAADLDTTIHEVMHQWFGDNVSPVDWNDIWLNEGPATYAEYQVPFEGLGTASTSTEQAIFSTWDGTPADDELWTVPTAKMSEASELFGAQVYDRGAMTLEALRTSIGAAPFAELMKQWQARHGGTSQRTSDFIALAEEVAGRDLDAFFETWIYTTGKPAWPAKFDLALKGPEGSLLPGASSAFTLSSTNTGKVQQTGSVVTLDLSAILPAVALGDLPAGVDIDGTTLTWTVPSTAVGTSSDVSIPFTVRSGTAGTSGRVVARASTLGSTCAECTTDVVVKAQQIGSSPVPTISGTPRVGETLTAVPGAWDGGTTLSYQWLRDGSPIAGATAPSYALVATDWRTRISVAVTGSKPDHESLRRTSTTTSVRPGVQVRRPTPAVKGTPKVGRRLTVKRAAYDPGVSLTYTWYVGGHRVGSSTPRLRVAKSYRGHRISVRVSARKPGYTTWTSRSSTTGKAR